MLQKILILFIFYIFASEVECYANLKTGKVLQLLHIVFRHGERTPADTYPSDPHINQTFAPYGWGHVTNSGKRNLYETGQWLKKRYGLFLGPDYFPDLIHAQATGAARTHMSLATVLTGLFPPEHSPMEWNKELNWQPIPIYSQSLEDDNLLLVRINCPRYHEALEEVMTEKDIDDKLYESQSLLEVLSTHTQMDIKSAEDVASIWGTLTAEKKYGLELPEWTKEYYPEKMEELTKLSYIWNVYNDELKRIKAGPFLKKMSNEWKDKQANKLPNKRKVFMYGGHDSTVVNILHALGVWKPQVPGYGVTAIFELFQDRATNEYELKIYQKNEGERLVALQLPNCSLSCPLDDVLKMIEPIIPTDSLTKECNPHNPFYTSPPLGGP